MVSIEEIKDYCNDKNIIIVGNSSSLLSGNHKTIIDSYDIVVRINKGYLHRQNLYSDKIGSKTHILSLGIKSATFSANIVQSNIVSYILSPIIYSDRLNYKNVYNVDEQTYKLLMSELGGFKPSTGISTYNFFNKFVNFKRLDLIGFDFFKTSTKKRNILGHCYISDHHGIKEFKYFEKTKDSNRTKLHSMLSNKSQGEVPTLHIKINKAI